MRSIPSLSNLLLLLGAAAVVPGCLDPTEIIVAISTDVSCKDRPEIGIAVGTVAELETIPYATATTECDEATGTVGTIVIVPGKHRDTTFGVRIVGGLTLSADDCQKAGYKGGCIVARRIVGFLPSRILHLPVQLEASCIDVPCEATQTCRNGACFSADIPDLSECLDDAGCDVGGPPSGGAGGEGGSGGTTSDTGGASSGGESGGTGGVSASGGSGGNATGGADTGGSGGTATGGAGTGGADTGGSGGTATGGAGTGGATALPMDDTEVTRSAYADWLATTPTTASQPSYCSWNADFTPSCSYPPTAGDTRPVSCVDWCDAYAYCTAQGRRLCGKIGGGRNTFGDFANPVASTWYEACTAGSIFAFPYGSTYQTGICNGLGASQGDVVPVGAMTDCRSTLDGYTTYRDLSGNVAEWEDSCDAQTGSSDVCHYRGGSFASNQANLRCDANVTAARSFQSAEIGFRCCSSP